MVAAFLLISLVNQSTGVVELPKGIARVVSEIRIPDGAHDLEIRGANSILRVQDGFEGRAVMSCKGCRNIKITGLTIEGDRGNMRKAVGLPPAHKSFADFSHRNGILMEDSDGVTISGVKFREIADFPILITKCKRVLIEKVNVQNCGSKNAKGRNNATGGVLLEEGTSDFTVRQSSFTDVLGNAVWTHSLYSSPRNARGLISENQFRNIGRDAIQVGHATAVTVEQNQGARIGFPANAVDVEGAAWPVAIDTAGNVDASYYVNNHFEEINGKCIDLDGFHDGDVRQNVCINHGWGEDYEFGHYGIVMNNTNPDMQSKNIRIIGNQIEGMKFGGIFVIGRNHTIADNRLSRLNTAHCNDNPKVPCLYDAAQQDLLRSGIYLGRKAEHVDAARAIRIVDNKISGYGMDQHCIVAAPGVDMSSEYMARNECKP